MIANDSYYSSLSDLSWFVNQFLSKDKCHPTWMIDVSRHAGVSDWWRISVSEKTPFYLRTCQDAHLNYTFPVCR